MPSEDGPDRATAVGTELPDHVSGSRLPFEESRDSYSAIASIYDAYGRTDYSAPTESAPDSEDPLNPWAPGDKVRHAFAAPILSELIHSLNEAEKVFDSGEASYSPRPADSSSRGGERINAWPENAFMNPRPAPLPPSLPPTSVMEWDDKRGVGTIAKGAANGFVVAVRKFFPPMSKEEKTTQSQTPPASRTKLQKKPPEASKRR